MRRPKVSITIYFAVVSSVMLVIWGWFILEQSTDIRIVRRLSGGLKAANAEREPMHIAYPFITTAVVMVGGYFHYWRHVDFVRRAKVVTGRITNIGSLAQASMRDVSYEFTYEGIQYSKKKSFSEPTVKELEVGLSVEVLVDPRNPNRSSLMIDYLFFEEVEDEV